MKKGKGNVIIHNLPANYSRLGKYVVASCQRGLLTYYGTWKDKADASSVADALGNACVVEMEA